MENQGLLTLKEVNGVSSVTSVQRIHSLFKGIKVQNPESLRAGIKNNKDDDKNTNEKKKGDGKIAVIELYKFPKKLKYVRTRTCDHICLNVKLSLHCLLSFLFSSARNERSSLFQLLRIFD